MRVYKSDIPVEIVIRMDAIDATILHDFVQFARKTEGLWEDIAPVGSRISDTLNDFIRNTDLSK